MGMPSVLKRVRCVLVDLMCFFTVDRRGLYNATRCCCSNLAAALCCCLLSLRLAWLWRLECVEFATGLLRAVGIDMRGVLSLAVEGDKLAGRAGGIDMGGTSSLTVEGGGRVGSGESGGVERGDDAAEDGRERSGDVKGEVSNKPASRVRLSSRSLGKLTLLSAETTTGNDMVRNPKWKEISFDGAQ